MTAFQRRYYDGGGAATSLASSMGAADTSFVLTSATGWPGSPANDFAVCIDRGTSNEEKILCSSNSGTTVTVVTRGIDGTSATTHSATAPVVLCAISTDFDEANQLTNLAGNLATGSLIVGAGAGTLPTALGVGSAASILAGGTSPSYVSGTNGQVFGVSGGSVAAITLASATVLTPVISSISLTATNGSYIEATASITVTSPAVTAGNKFGAFANYAATNASPVTVTAASGNFIGPGIPASTTSILLGAPNANVSFASDGTNWILTSGEQDSGWITPSLGNSWATVSATPKYRLKGNRVSLQGDMNGGGTATVPWVMPSGYRPLVSGYYAAAATTTSNVAMAAIVQITVSTGNIQPIFGATLTDFALNGISYTVD